MGACQTPLLLAQAHHNGIIPGRSSYLLCILFSIFPIFSRLPQRRHSASTNYTYCSHLQNKSNDSHPHFFRDLQLSKCRYFSTRPHQWLATGEILLWVRAKTLSFFVIPAFTALATFVCMEHKLHYKNKQLLDHNKPWQYGCLSVSSVYLSLFFLTRGSALKRLESFFFSPSVNEIVHWRCLCRGRALEVGKR